MPMPLCIGTGQRIYQANCERQCRLSDVSVITKRKVQGSKPVVASR